MMKEKLQAILNQYNEGQITLFEMQDEVNELGIYMGYKMQNGKRFLKAFINHELIQVECEIIKNNF